MAPVSPVRSGCSGNIGRESRPATPPGGLAQCSVGSTDNRCGRKLPAPSTRPFTQVTRTGRSARASMVNAG
jgi:hypothetical protein